MQPNDEVLMHPNDEDLVQPNDKLDFVLEFDKGVCIWGEEISNCH